MIKWTKIYLKKHKAKLWYLTLGFSYTGDPFISILSDNKILSNSSLHLLILTHHFLKELSNHCTKLKKFSQNESKMFSMMKLIILFTKDEKGPNADFKLILLEAKASKFTLSLRGL